VNQNSIIFSLGNDDEFHHHNHSHQLFCEMDELKTNKENILEWREAARWIKFEENVENGGRWSKPHVATLSLHSLFELRNGIANGTVLLDLDCSDLSSIVDILIDEIVLSGKMEASKREQLKSVLLSRHCHQHEKEYRKLLDKGEKKSLPLIKSLADMGKKSSKKDFKESENAMGTTLRIEDSKSKVYLISLFLQNLRN
jgi:hypothetical protein